MTKHIIRLLVGDPRTGKVMRRVKYSVYALLFAISLVVSLAASPDVANATSDYDNLLEVSPTLFVYADGGTKTKKMDISASWLAEFKQTYNKRVAQNIGWPTNFVSELEDIMSSEGSWGVFMRETSDGNLVSIVGTRDPNAYCRFVGSASSGSYECASNSGYGFVRADYFTHSSYGGNGCIGSHANRCSDNGMNIYDAPTVISDTAGYTFISIPNATLSNYRFFYMNFDFTYPPGYEGQRIPTGPPAPKYIAMGDSFSSGEGNPPFEAGTDTSSNTCHRSAKAYPRLLQHDLDLGPTAFVACSGAVSDYIINEYNRESVELPQAVYISEDTEYVTITIGGNNIGFGGTIEACVRSTSTQGCLDAIAAANSKASDPNLLSDIEDVLSGIKTLGGGDTQVIAVGYPQLYPKYDDISGPCTWGNPALVFLSKGEVSGRAITESEINELREVHDILNGVIETAVTNTSDPDIHFVDPTDEFESHEICGSSDDWLHEVFLHVSTAEIHVGSFHPNSMGQAAYAALVEDKIGEFSQ